MHSGAKFLSKHTKEVIWFVVRSAKRTQFCKTTNFVEVYAVEMPPENVQPVFKGESLNVRKAAGVSQRTVKFIEIK